MRCYFCADAAPELGAGHVVRCACLAKVLHDTGHQVCMLGGAKTGPPRSWAWKDLPQRSVDDVPWGWLKELQQDQPDWVIADHYAIDDQWISALPKGTRCLVIDDVPGSRLVNRAHAVLNQQPGVPASAYAVPALLGLQYALIRSAFRQRSWKQTREDILILAGGTDPLALGPRLAQVLSPLPCLLVGPDPGTLPHSAQACGLLGAEELASLLATCSAACIAAGGSVWEAACIGIPQIVIPTADNQSHMLRGLRNLGGVIVPADQLAQAKDALVSTQHRGSQKWLDGLGAERVAHYLLTSLTA